MSSPSGAGPGSVIPDGVGRAPGRFRWLVLATIAATYLLIVMGAVVRVTGSGLGCPDWPLCYGRLFPPLEFAPLLEYTHRLVGAIVSALIVAVVGSIWLRFRHHRRLVVLASGVVVLLVIQIGLGAVTVLTELSPLVVLIHLGLAMLVLGALVMLAVYTGPVGGGAPTTGDSRQPEQWVGFRTLVLTTAAAIYALVLTGAAVRATGATWSCIGWPDCNGILLPLGVDPLVDTHLLHRFTAYTIAVLAVLTVVRARLWRRRFPAVWWGALALVAGVVAQGAIGVWGVTAGFVPLVQALHVAGASAAWTAAVALAALVTRSSAPAASGGVAEPLPADVGHRRTTSGRIRAAVADDPPPPPLSPLVERGPDGEAAERSLYRASAEGVGAQHAAPLHDRRRPLSGFLQLTKPRIVLLLLAPTLCAMIVAADGWPSPLLVGATLLGGALAAGAANAFNHYLDRDIDAIMRRTAHRALPAGVLRPRQAVWFGLVLAALSFVVLTVFANLLAALLTQAAIVFYVFVYTRWLKRSSPSNIVIGGAAGAVPPLVGWAAVTESIGLLALYLFAIIFYWTPPHFWALALLIKDDYARARIPMLPVVRGGAETRRQIVLYSLLMVAITLLLVPFQLAGPFYLASAVLLGGLFVFYAVRLLREASALAARLLFKYSVVYLYLILAAIVVDQKFIGV